MVNYDLSFVNGTNVTNMLQATVKINESSDYVFGSFLMVAIFTGIYFMYRKEETIKEFIISGFISCILGVLLLFLNIINIEILLAFMFLFFITFILNFFQ